MEYFVSAAIISIVWVAGVILMPPVGDCHKSARMLGKVFFLTFGIYAIWIAAFILVAINAR